jgi:hypothetical protein
VPTVVVFDFPWEGPFGEEMTATFGDLAGAIASEPGLLWKIWLESVDRAEAAGVYLFADERSARAYIEKQRRRLERVGIAAYRARVFAVNEPLTAITRGPLAAGGDGPLSDGTS